MIDYINISLKNFNYQTWLSDSRLSFEFKISDSLDKDDNIIQTSSEIAHYMGLDFVHTLSGQCFVKGSIHRFFNAGGNNADRFSYTNFIKAVNELKDFGIDPKKAMLRSFEFGLNLTIQEKHLTAKSFYNSIIYRSGEIEKCMSDDGNNLIGKQFTTEDMAVKSYDKKQQAKLQNTTEIVRYELRFRRMRLLKRLGIETLYDLTDKNNLIQLFEKKLLKSVDESILLDWKALPNTNKLPHTQKRNFLNFRNPKWWREQKMTAKSRNRQKISFEKLITKHAQYDIKQILKQKLISEFDAAIELNELETQKNRGMFAACIVSGNRADTAVTIKSKFCSVCGKEITHQKKDSKYCSDNRKCRDKAYNLKVSEKKQAKRSQKEKEILHLIKDLGNEFNLIRTTNPNRKKIKGVPSRKTSIIATIGGKKRYYHGADARFFLNEFDKRTKTEVLTQCPDDTRLEHAQ
ncbi:MAG: hypothetical protein ACERIH_00230 [Labilibaculum antarcticum]